MLPPHHGQMIIDAEDQILWHSEALWLAVPDTVRVLEDLLNCTRGEVHIIWMSGVPNIVDLSRRYTQALFLVVIRRALFLMVYSRK